MGVVFESDLCYFIYISVASSFFLYCSAINAFEINQTLVGQHNNGNICTRLI